MTTGLVLHLCQWLVSAKLIVSDVNNASRSRWQTSPIPKEWLSSAENSADREQRIGRRTGFHTYPSTLFFALLHRFVVPQMSQSSWQFCTISSDDLLFRHLHSAADQFFSLRITIVLLPQRMASNSGEQVDQSFATTSSADFVHDKDDLSSRRENDINQY